MKVLVFPHLDGLGKTAAQQAAEILRQAIQVKGEANMILATGASQFQILENLVNTPDIDWRKVSVFHLDEYIGLPQTHPASFRKFLTERFLDKVEPVKQAFFVGGDAPDPQQECKRLGEIIAAHPIDVALIGIGENGHVAFNDPPADFDTEEPYIVVNLDEACRRQQLGEGWFKTLEDVPPTAISMGIKQIMKSKHIICSCPDERKAVPVRNALEGPLTNLCPASILRTHPDCTLYLDEASASLLNSSSKILRQ